MLSNKAPGEKTGDSQSGDEQIIPNPFDRLKSQNEPDGIDQKCRQPGHRALRQDDAQRGAPLSQLLVHRANCRNAGRIEQRENQERDGRERGEHAG